MYKTRSNLQKKNFNLRYKYTSRLGRVDVSVEKWDRERRLSTYRLSTLLCGIDCEPDP